MNLWIGILISTFGLGYFIYGKKSTDFHFLIFGIILMIYPYFLSNPVYTIVIGLVLLAAPFITSKFL